MAPAHGIPLGRGAPAQEARGIPHRGEAEPNHRRILRAVVAVVDAAGLEAAVERDRPRLSGEAPGRARHRDGGRVTVLAHVQLRLRIVEAGHRMRDVITVGQRQHVHARVRPELAAHPLGDARHPRHRHRHHAVAARHVGLPADPGHRVAVAHEELIAEVFPGRRIVRARGAVEHAERDLAPAVRHVEEQPAAARRRAAAAGRSRRSTPRARARCGAPAPGPRSARSAGPPDPPRSAARPRSSRRRRRPEPARAG